MAIFNYDHQRVWWQQFRRHVNASDNDHPLAGQWVTYGRTRANLMDYPLGTLSWHTHYWAALTGAIAIPTDANLLFVGAGFGFMAEAARAAGWASIGCIDDSNWIEAHAGDLAWRHDGAIWVQDTPNAIEVIHKLPLSATNPIKNAMKPVFGTPTGEPDWVITEFMLASLTDPTDPLFDAGEGDADDVTPALDDCDALLAPGGTVLHLVTTAPSAKPPFNVKTLAEWKALRPAHRFAPPQLSRDFEVL